MKRFWQKMLQRKGRVERTLSVLMLGAALCLYALHFAHLQADFPNHSPWMDWAKYTDEGWYGNAAIEHYMRGHWHVEGDFNPAAALPVWPVLELVIFQFTGVSLVAARALTVGVFGATIIVAWFLLRRFHRTTTASLAVLLLAISPFCYAFMRMAVLEPLLIFLTMLAILAASYATPQRWWPAIAVGILLPFMVLTKTTAIFLAPAVFLMLFFALRARWRTVLLQAGAAAAIAAALWCAYFFLIVRPHYLVDYAYLFSANAYTGAQLSQIGQVLQQTFGSGLWMDIVLYPAFAVLFVAAVVMAIVQRRKWFAQQPLLTALLCWIGGYFFFLAYHDNIQPRYYLVIDVPMTLAIAIGAEMCWSWFTLQRAKPRRLQFAAAASAMAAAAIAITLAIATDARLLYSFATKPEYTFLNAAKQIQQIVDHDPTRTHLVMSISGNEMTLMNGLPAICDDFGTMELEDRISAWRPGWYLAWNSVEDDKQEALDKFYQMQRVAEIPAMDDPARNLLILYKLVPLEEATPKRVKRPLRHLLDPGVEPRNHLPKPPMNPANSPATITASPAITPQPAAGPPPASTPPASTPPEDPTIVAGPASAPAPAPATAPTTGQNSHN